MAAIKLYVVVSMDFGGSSDVKLHYLGISIEAARSAFKHIEDEASVTADEYNGCKLLVNLLEIDDSVDSHKGFTLFWPYYEVKGVKVLNTNNKD